MIRSLCYFDATQPRIVRDNRNSQYSKRDVCNRTYLFEYRLDSFIFRVFKELSINLLTILAYAPY